MKDMAGSDFVRELFAQREWLGRLAFSLVNDEALAEDLVQETWLSALRTQPAREAGLRGWLATVLRNRARTHARDERERKRREEWAARQELLPSTGAVVERAAIQQEVAGVVMRLEEPYRETILLRFFDELPPRAIAGRMQVPVSTVKTRISRGLERLRVMLDESCGGDREAWMGMVGLLWVGHRNGALWKWVAAASVLVLGGRGAWLGLESDGSVVAPMEIVEFDAGAGRQALAGVERETLEGAREPTGGDRRLSELEQPAEALVAARAISRMAREYRGAPPGLVPVAGGSVHFGTDGEGLQQLAAKWGRKHESWMEVQAFNPASPRHERVLESFSLMGTEVTNEQYWEYCLASSARFPRTSMDGGGLGIPKGQAQMPVVDVSREDAEGYAAWAGLRLPTEFELEHAVRGKRDADFPWGDGWKPGRAMTSEHRRAGLQPVGGNRRGRTKSGIDGLGGNVREWTSSPFVAYPEWTGVFLDDWASGDWGSAGGVVRGGSFLTPPSHAHAAFRAASATTTRAGDLGFRCAASVGAGVDRSFELVRELSVARQDLGEFEIGRVLGVDQWLVSSDRVQPKAKHYAVITGYKYVVFVPVQRVDSGDGVVGVLSTSLDLKSPGVRAGTYLVSLKGLSGGGRSLVLESVGVGREVPVQGERVGLSPFEGRHGLELREVGDGGVGEIGFEVSVLGTAGGWWSLAWEMNVDEEAVAGEWRM